LRFALGGGTTIVLSPVSTANTRERLLQAAMEVFAERGFEAATIREICRRANANVAAVHYHFGDKQRLYTAIFDTMFTLLRERRRSFLPGNAPPQKRLRIYIRALFEEIFDCNGDAARCTQLSAIYLKEMARPTEILDRVVADHMRRDAEELYSIVGSLLGEDCATTEVINCSASVIGQILYYYQAEPIISRLHPDREPVPMRIDELVDHIWHFSLGGIYYHRDSLTSI
jgi:AcrR family transcriptional regulator